MSLIKQINFKNRLIFFSLFLIFKITTAQLNLIVNPSFEDTIQIPTNQGQFNLCKNWIISFGTPEYFSTFSPTTNTIFSNCLVSIPKSDFGLQYANEGNYYSGVGMFYFPSWAGYSKFSVYFELLGGKLVNPLNPSHVYNFNLYYSNAEISKYINNQLSVYFSKEAYQLNTGIFNPNSQIWYDTTINCITPQINNDTTLFLNSDTVNWHSFGGCFIAKGGEKFITIGNFKDGKYQKYLPLATNFTPSPQSNNNSEYSYLFIDDLSLYDMGYYSGTIKVKKDTAICNGIAYTIGNNIKDSSTINWWPPNGLSCTNCPNPIANPTVTTKYYVTKTLCNYISKDSITITVHTPTTTANAGASQTLCLNEQQQLGTNDANAYSTYTWQPYQNLSCLNCAQPFANAVGNITYTLSRQECSSITQSTVNLTLDDCELLLPQGISPNGDGLNEQLQVIVPNAQSAKLTVFNRWGSELYSVSNTKPATNSKYPLSIELTWDAKAHKGLILGNGIVPSGTYFYIVEVTQNNGTKKVYKEFVQVVY
ncbi:MAG: gliding motility-associated C-terminal domain-containing protein [Bacteroidetes bacterium]|nr:gliding motility-associated C-terminal domain-containing protein [Bacteroidota bacterium]